MQNRHRKRGRGRGERKLSIPKANTAHRKQSERIRLKWKSICQIEQSQRTRERIERINMPEQHQYTFPELYKSKYFSTVKRKQISFECSTPKKGLSDNSMRMLCIVPHFTIYNSLRQLEIRIVKFSERDWKIWILPHHLMRNNWTIYAEPLCKGCGNL